MQSAVGTAAALASVLTMGSLMAPRTAFSQDVNCPPGPGESMVRNNLLVSGPCEIVGTRVMGNVLVFSGGSLVARDINVSGNLQALTALRVQISDSRIRGNVELTELVGSPSAILTSRIDGSLLMQRNRMFLRIEDNDVGASVNAIGNTGGLELVDNQIGGNLSCSDNVPPPSLLDNDVAGAEVGQCAIAPPVTPPVTPPVSPPVTPPVSPPVTPPVSPPVTPPVTPPVPPEVPPAVPPEGPPEVPPAVPPEVPPPPAPPPAQPAFQSVTTGGGGGSADPLLLAALVSLLFWRRFRRCACSR